MRSTILHTGAPRRALRLAAGVAGLVAALVAALGAGRLVAATTDAVAVRTQTLPNGVRVVLAPDSTATITQVTVCVAAGLAAEPAGRSGIGQIAGLLYARAIGPSDEDLAPLESDAVASTSPDDFCMETSVPEEFLGRVLEREAARLGRTEVNDAAFATVAGEVRAQRRAAAVSPVVAGLERLYGLAFKGRPYERPLYGLERDDAQLTADAARAYFREATAPARVVVVVAGRFDPDTALALAAASFGGLARRSAPVRPAAAKPGGAARDTLRMATSTALVLIGWPGPAASDADAAALEVLARAISSGPESRIAANLLADRKTFLRAEGHLDARRDGALLFCIAIPARGAAGDAVEEQLVAVAEYLASAPLDDEALNRAKQQAEVALLTRIQPARGRARALAVAEMAEGGAGRLAVRIDALRRLTAADLQRAAAKVLQPSRRVIVWVVPPGEGGRP